MVVPRGRRHHRRARGDYGHLLVAAPSFFSRSTLPPSFADPDLLLRSSGADPLVTAGFWLPGVKNAGLWRVCYTNPEMPNLLDANTTLEEVASSETFGLSTVVALGARDAAATDRVASDAPRRAGAPDPDGDRNVNATKFVADIRATTRGQPSLRESLRRVHWRRATLRRHLGPDFQDKMHATRALTLVFILQSAWVVTSSSVRCAAAPTAGGFGYLTLVRFSRAGPDGWSPADPHQHLRLDASRRDAVTAGFKSISTRPTTCRATGATRSGSSGRNGSHHARRDIQMLLIAPRKTPSLAEVPRRSRE